MTPYIYTVQTKCTTAWIPCPLRTANSRKHSPDTLVAAWLLFSDGSRYPFFMDKGDKIHIKGSAAELNSMEITGNPHNEELTAFRKELKGLGKPSEKVLEEKAGKFINEHHSSLASIYLLDKYFAQKKNRIIP